MTYMNNYDDKSTIIASVDYIAIVHYFSNSDQQNYYT